MTSKHARETTVNCLLVVGGRPNLHSGIVTEIQKLHCGKENSVVCEETHLAEHTTTDGALKIP